MGFDNSRYDWYPDSLGGPGQVSMSSGSPRPALRTPLGTFGVHYAGAGTSWLDPDDTARELLGVELNHARPSGKPNEYNSVSDAQSATWEYAGPYRAAHSSGNNSTVWGHLTLYGLETLTERDAQALIVGIRRARRQCVEAGYLTVAHEVKAHNELPNAATSCPGPLFTNKRWWAQITAPLATFTPSPPATPTPTEDTDMLVTLLRPKGHANIFSVTPDGARHLGGETYRRLSAQMAKAGVDTTVIVTDHPQEIASVLALSGLSRADLVAVE
jgi:hypothetical protein